MASPTIETSAGRTARLEDESATGLQQSNASKEREVGEHVLEREVLVERLGAQVGAYPRVLKQRLHFRGEDERAVARTTSRAA